MGMVKSYGLSWMSAANDSEMAYPQAEAPVPVGSQTSAPVKEDSDDSCDSILKNTPIFPDGPQETSSPSIPQASSQNTLPSKETNARTPSPAAAPSVALEREAEKVSRVLDAVIDTKLGSKSSEAPTMSATDKNRSDPSESPRPSGPSHQKVPKNDNGRQREPQVTKAAAREQANNKSQTTQPKQTQNMSTVEPGSLDTKVQKGGERAGTAKNSTSSGKKGRKAKHSKSSSVNSNKMTRSDSSNFNSQGKQNAPEATAQGNKSSKTKPVPEERPIPHRLTPGASATSCRRRRGLSTSTTVPLQQNASQQENITPAPKPSPPATITTSITSTNPAGPAYLRANLNRQLSEVSSTFSQFRMAEKPPPSTPPIPLQRGKFETSSTSASNSSIRGGVNTYPNQPDRATFKAENRPFYPPNPVQPIQKGYPMQNSAALSHQIGQNQATYNQTPQYSTIRPQNQSHQQSLQSHQAYQQNQQIYQPHQQHQSHGFHQNFPSSGRRGPENNVGYAGPQIYSQPRMQQYPGGNFPFHQPQTQPKPPRFQRAASHTAPPTPHHSNKYVSNVGNQNVYGGVPFNRYGTGQTGSGSYSYGNLGPEFGRGHIRNRSNQSLHDYGRSSKRPTITQAARYQPRSPSPPPIVKLSVRDRRLLWPIGPFIPLNRMTFSPSELDSTNFVNVLCTTVGVLRLPFSVEFLRMLKATLPPKHGDHIITFPTILADSADMTPYWERCYFCQRFLFKYAKHLGSKPFEELPMKDWPRIEIMLGTDNTEKSKFNIYLSQPDEKRLLFRCVEQKLDDSDKAPKATFFVTVHQTGVNQVQYSDPYLHDEKVPLPPLDGSRDPRTAPEFQYNLPHYLCLNENRGLASNGFTDIGVPAKRLNFHPFGKGNFDSLWYGMAHLQELVTADDNKSVNAALCWDPDHVFGIPNVVQYCKKRTAVMMGNGEPKFAEHDEVLKMNCKAAMPPSPHRRMGSVSADDEFEWERESRSPDASENVKSTSA
ncbi:hypothetical protein TWF481_000330 [Arthrobotrys musiformis]|uniref:Uncharacterized protein n=1 Tax=Arthrobotrys musiformis TaxID=47236 RepID=A0AAV9WMB1_9PEZI